MYIHTTLTGHLSVNYKSRKEFPSVFGTMTIVECNTGTFLEMSSFISQIRRKAERFGSLLLQRERLAKRTKLYQIY